MNEEANYHMTPDQFREYGRAVVDWIADYYENVENYPVLSRVAPGDIFNSLPAAAPQQGEPFDDILADVSTLVMPGITHWQSPSFFAYFPANASGPSILGDFLSSGLAVQGMIWATSPACTEVETRILDWVVGMLGLPEKFLSSSSGGGVIQDTASSSALCSMLAARERATGYSINKKGGTGKLIAYASTQGHSSMEKAAMVAGIGVDNLRLVDVDETYSMRPDLLEQQIQKDIDGGLTPFWVGATIGTTSSNAIDPLTDIGKVCQKYEIWMHVDGAMSGTAALCPEFRHLQDGLEYADSYCFNPHKWMFTNFDCDCFFVADRKVLIQTLSILPEYLRNKATESGAVIDYRDWHVPLGRRFRALKLWFVIRHYGVEGLQYHVRQHVALAQEFANWVEADPDFELFVPAPLNVVCFRHRAGDEVSEAIMNAVNASGEMFLTHTKLDGRFVLRMSIAQTNTKRRHVEHAWELLREAAANVQSADSDIG
jgi:aromatic-L-amino-acid decarboxylase